MSVNTGNDSLQGDDMAMMVRFGPESVYFFLPPDQNVSECDNFTHQMLFFLAPEALAALGSRGLPLSLPRNFMPEYQCTNFLLDFSIKVHL